MDLWVCKINRPVLYSFRGAAHEDEILLVFYCAVQYLPAVFKALPEKCLLIVTGSRNANQKLVGVCFHSLLEEVVLLGLFEGMYLIAYGDIAVKRILGVRIGRQCPDVKRSVPQVSLHAVLIVVVDYMDMATILLILSHALDVVVQEVEAFQCLHERSGGNIGFASAPPIPQRQRPRKRSGERGLDIFSWDKNQGFVKSDNVSSR